MINKIIAKILKKRTSEGLTSGNKVNVYSSRQKEHRIDTGTFVCKRDGLVVYESDRFSGDHRAVRETLVEARHAQGK